MKSALVVVILFLIFKLYISYESKITREECLHLISTIESSEETIYDLAEERHRQLKEAGEFYQETAQSMGGDYAEKFPWEALGLKNDRFSKIFASHHSEDAKISAQIVKKICTR